MVLKRLKKLIKRDIKESAKDEEIKETKEEISLEEEWISYYIS